MSVALRSPMTLQQFLEWEARQESRYEFDGVGPRAITGGTAAHAAIQRNLIIAVGNRLRGRTCDVYGSELKIEVAGSLRYPDAFVICVPVPPRATVVREPVVVFEILSESTAEVDLVVKNAEYRETPSVQRYVVLQQTMAACVVFSRRHGEWVIDRLVGVGAVLAMAEIGIEVPLAEIYEGVGFADADGIPGRSGR